jgi:hypothetical protein
MTYEAPVGRFPSVGIAWAAVSAPVVRSERNSESDSDFPPMALPPLCVQGGLRQGAGEALEEEGEEVAREIGASLTVGRRTAPQPRPMGQLTAGGMAMQHLQQAELYGRDRREDAPFCY